MNQEELNEVRKFLAEQPPDPVPQEQVDADKEFIAEYNRKHKDTYGEIIAIEYDDLHKVKLLIKVNRSTGWVKSTRYLCSELYDHFGDHIRAFGSFRNARMEPDESGEFAILTNQHG